MHFCINCAALKIPPDGLANVSNGDDGYSELVEIMLHFESEMFFFFFQNQPKNKNQMKWFGAWVGHAIDATELRIHMKNVIYHAKQTHPGLDVAADDAIQRFQPCFSAVSRQNRHNKCTICISIHQIYSVGGFDARIFSFCGPEPTSNCALVFSLSLNCIVQRFETLCIQFNVLPPLPPRRITDMTNESKHTKPN